MRKKQGILLTGATGLLGRYLLRDLLLARRDVAVLVRADRSAPAQQRIDEIVSFWSEALGVSLARPVVLTGDLRADELGLGAGERRWLSRWCRSVLHAAAHVGFHPTRDGEPWRTNFEGTRRLLELCAGMGLDELHHVSTAFVCGERSGPVREDELECGQAFHNDYERSKYEAERLLRRAPRLRLTVYRPSVIVGDSRTGHTSAYHGFYRFLELGNLLAGPAPGKTAGSGESPAARRLPLRVPFTGEEPHDLVPVDWVAGAIVRLLHEPNCHGSTYHLVVRQPIPGRLIKEIAEDVLAIDGVYWVGPDGLADPSPLEEQFLAEVRHFWPYCHGAPAFEWTNTAAALPGFPAPLLGREELARLIRFAVADRWGRGRRCVGQASCLSGERQARCLPHGAFDCAHYVEEFFPWAVRHSTLAAIPLDVTVGLDVVGPGGGCWTACWTGGELLSLDRGADPSAAVVFRLDPATFAAVVAGRLGPQEAFFARRIEIEGDVEKGLKLAALFGRLVHEHPWAVPAPEEAADALAAHA